MKNTFNYSGMNPFALSITYLDSHDVSVETEPQSHTHTQCEIYMNLSGDVSFIVEGNIYRISRGNIIITRPSEYHHCIYHNTLEHEHFCMLFSCEGNEEILDFFFDRCKGEKNHIILPNDKINSMINHFNALLNSDGSGAIDDYYHFFKILNTIRNASTSEIEIPETIPQNLRKVLQIIDEHFTDKLTVTDLAAQIFVSTNTLERYFKKFLYMSPSEYIKRKRLLNACILMQSREPISSVAFACGFSDTSAFISAFKQQFGMTPYKYIKQLKS